jgi:enoyl-CoA hydratase
MGYVKYTVSDQIGVLTLDRPDELNALSKEGIAELESLFARLADGWGSGKEPRISCVVMTGSGKAFVAGASIGELRSMDSAGAREFSRIGNRLLRSIECFPVPVIAAVNGHALGGGLELALAADIALASTTAKFGMPEVTLGIMPGFGGIPRLVRCVGDLKARELVLTGRIIDANEALRIGLINGVFEPGELMTAALSTAARIAAASPNAIGQAKRYFRFCADNDWGVAREKEPELFGSLFDHHDACEGLTAFTEKRKPQWGELRREK